MVTVERGEATGFGVEARQVAIVQLGGRKITLPYDSLIGGAGVRGSYF